MIYESYTGIDEYNSFCKDLKAGSILYNIDSSNSWGQYLLVASIIPVTIYRYSSYTMLLIGLKRQDGKYIPNNMCISFTPEYAKHVPFLKLVGYCKFNLITVLEETNVNLGLVTVYANTDLHKFASKLSVRKPRNRKYDKDGKLVIKKPGNK